MKRSADPRSPLPALLAALLCCASFGCANARGAAFPAPTEGDCTLPDFHFTSGETLPSLRVHYRTLGTPRRDAAGQVHNAVLILHGTTGNGANFLTEAFAGHLFGAGQLLAAASHFI